MSCMGWMRAKRCEATACVEVTVEHGSVGVRNSKVPGETVWFDPHEWSMFIDGVKAGDFDHVDTSRSL